MKTIQGFFSKLFYKFPKSVLKIFSGYNLLWHLLVIALTIIIVKTDFDWRYFIFMGKFSWGSLFFPAIMLGGLLPILFPIALFIIGKIRNSARTINTGFAVAQAAIAGLLISDFYKFFTGRIPPSGYFRQAVSSRKTLVDVSHGFQFGFFRGGVFWGWPSSHTTVAFSVALALCALYPKSKIIRFFSIAYAFYVGIGVSFTIHWFSEFVAGAIIGMVIGTVVGRSFRDKFGIDNN